MHVGCIGCINFWESCFHGSLRHNKYINLIVYLLKILLFLVIGIIWKKKEVHVLEQTERQGSGYSNTWFGQDIAHELTNIIKLRFPGTIRQCKNEICVMIHLIVFVGCLRKRRTSHDEALTTKASKDYKQGFHNELNHRILYQTFFLVTIAKSAYGKNNNLLTKSLYSQLDFCFSKRNNKRLYL